MRKGCLQKLTVSRPRGLLHAPVYVHRSRASSHNDARSKASRLMKLEKR